MWRPGFAYIDQRPATLAGYHRSLCVYSHVHRGTREKPGLVFGLDEGGQCHGMAFLVAPENTRETLDYLRKREQATAIYVESRQQISLGRPNDPVETRQRVTAVTYLVDPAHEQYAGTLAHAQQLKFIHQGKGQSGHCRDYILSAARHLQELGVEDKSIQALARDLSATGVSKKLA